jgi:hypothetical protein
MTKPRKIPDTLVEGDQIYNPFFGMGIVDKVFRADGVKRLDCLHVTYKRRHISTIHTDMALCGIVMQRGCWHMQDIALRDRTPTCWVETHQYNLRTLNMTSYVKPAYTTPSGRLRFSVTGDPVKHGIAVSSLGQVRVTNYLVTMYVLRDCPAKDKHKASFWKTVARCLVDKLIGA